jgi:hypothetical protein
MDLRAPWLQYSYDTLEQSGTTTSKMVEEGNHMMKFSKIALFAALCSRV